MSYLLVIRPGSVFTGGSATRRETVCTTTDEKGELFLFSPLLSSLWASSVVRARYGHRLCVKRPPHPQVDSGVDRPERRRREDAEREREEREERGRRWLWLLGALALRPASLGQQGRECACVFVVKEVRWEQINTGALSKA